LGVFPPAGSPWRDLSPRGDPGLLGHRGRLAPATSPARPPEAVRWSAPAGADLASRRRRHRNTRAAPPSLTDSTLGLNGLCARLWLRHRPPNASGGVDSMFHVLHRRQRPRVAILGACARGLRFASGGSAG